MNKDCKGHYFNRTVVILLLEYKAGIALSFYLHCGFLTLIPIIRLQPVNVSPVCLCAPKRC